MDRRPAFIVSLAVICAWGNAVAVGVSGGVGVANRYFDGPDEQPNLTYSMAVEAECLHRLRVRPVGGVQYFVADDGRPDKVDWGATVQVVTAYGGVRFKLSDSEAPRPIDFEVGPAIVFLHFAESRFRLHSDDYVLSGFMCGLGARHRVSERLDFEFAVRAIFSRGFAYPKDNASYGGRQKGVHQVTALVGMSFGNR